jgi:hypothetical protein
MTECFGEARTTSFNYSLSEHTFGNHLTPSQIRDIKGFLIDFEVYKEGMENLETKELDRYLELFSLCAKKAEGQSAAGVSTPYIKVEFGGQQYLVSFLVTAKSMPTRVTVTPIKDANWAEAFYDSFEFFIEDGSIKCLDTTYAQVKAFLKEWKEVA